MANIYVRSSDGLDTDTGATWGLAKGTAGGAAAIDNAGDLIATSSAHNETLTAATTYNFAGTYSNPTKLYSVNDTAEPPTAIQIGATINSGVNSLTIAGSLHCLGYTFNIGSGGSNTLLTLSSADQNFQIYENTNIFVLTNSGAGLFIGSLSNTVESFTVLKNCSIKFSGINQKISCAHGALLIQGGNLATGFAAITAGLFAALSNQTNIKVSNFDMSNLAASAALVMGACPASGQIVFVNCKLPNNWTGGLCASAPINPGFRAVMYNCGSYSHRVEMASGTLIPETTLIKTGGSVEGTTATSWKITTNSTANELVNCFVTEDLTIENDAIGTTKTVNVDILHDSLTALTNADIWLEVDYLDSSSTTKGVLATNKRSDPLATPTNHPASSATWTTTGLANPNKQTLQVSITPQKAGNIYVRVCVGIASKTLMIDYAAYLT